jgi:hypothetical protein
MTDVGAAFSNYKAPDVSPAGLPQVQDKDRHLRPLYCVSSVPGHLCHAYISSMRTAMHPRPRDHARVITDDDPISALLSTGNRMRRAMCRGAGWPPAE